MPNEIKLPDFDGLRAHLISELHRRISQRTPVDTGRARAGWEITEVGIRNDVPYIGFLEEGTTNMRPFGMVKTSLQEIPSIIKDYLK